jgi:hypothetical protein
MESLKLYKKRIKDNELVEIGYQSPHGWKLHKIEPTPRFIADFLEKRGRLELSSYHPGTFTGDRGNIEICVPKYPQELFINESEVIGFCIGENNYYYDDFAHSTTQKTYD